MYNPLLPSVTPEPDQLPATGPGRPADLPDRDALARARCRWTVLVKINEIQAKMAHGPGVQAGALRDLGEKFPEQKMQEIFEE